MARTSIDIDTLVHANPIPAASRIGPLIESGIIPPYNDGVREVPDTLEAMVANLFRHIGGILSAADATWDDVIKITFFYHDRPAAKDAVNAMWLDTFPDPESRPARHTMQVPPAPDKRISCVFTAYVES